MKAATLPTILLLIGLALAPWFGGHVLFDAEPMSGSDFWFSAFVSRTNPAVNHALIATFILLAVAIAAFRRNVLQIPGPLIAGLLFLLWIWIGISVMGSRFKHESILELARYTSYLFTLFACVLLLGRGTLARSALIAIFVGTTLVALSGLNEFMRSMRIAPDWRIFAGWQNPNAVAGLFAVVLPVGVALALSSKQGAERLLFVLGSSLICVGLWLTASKGGLLAAAVGLLALAA
nr:hypothetical protein [Armatimonadota bacterium]